MAHRGGDIVGGHEDGTEEKAACQELHSDIDSDKGGEDGYSCDNGHGDVPGYRAGSKEIDKSNEEGYGSDFTHGTAGEADGLVEKVDVARCDYALLEFAEGSCTGGGVEIVHAVLNRKWPCGHLHREGQEQEHSAYERRVENVATEAAECHFADADCNHATDEDCPYRKVRREVEGKKQACEDCRHVADTCLLTQHVTGDKIFSDDAAGNGGYDYDCCADAEAVEREGDGGNQGDNHVCHESPDGHRGLRMWRW